MRDLGDLSQHFIAVAIDLVDADNPRRRSVVTAPELRAHEHGPVDATCFCSEPSPLQRKPRSLRQSQFVFTWKYLNVYSRSAIAQLVTQQLAVQLFQSKRLVTVQSHDGYVGIWQWLSIVLLHDEGSRAAASDEDEQG